MRDVSLAHSMKRDRVVLVLQGRFAGCKAVIVEVKHASRKHKFDHCIVAGLSKYELCDSACASAK